MKTKNPFVLPALIAVLNLIPAVSVTAQTFTTLYSFTASSTNSHGTYTNSDGAYPWAGLIANSSSNTLYGTAYYGGRYGFGTVFAVNTDGTAFTNLHSFTGGSDGADPHASLVLAGSTLYGTTSALTLVNNSAGTVFAVNTDGTGFTNLHSFITGIDGAFLQAGLILSGNTLYGAAYNGGSFGNGTVFALGTNGTGFIVLYRFTPLSVWDPPNPQTNSDGSGPSGLILSGNKLYGTAAVGGSSGNGTVFALKTDGTGFTNLHSFTGTHFNSATGYATNSDGIYPVGGLISSGNALYGTANSGGSLGFGTIFTLNTDGTGFTNLHTFTGGSGGAFPQAGLILSGNSLYGTTAYGGSSGLGTVFTLNTDGTGFTNLPGYSEASLFLSGNTLYGTTQYGGSAGNGTVFSLSFRPQLTITPSGSNVILSWPTNVAGFDYTGYTLQSAPALTGTFTNLPAATNPYPNPISGPQRFFRLSQ